MEPVVISSEVMKESKPMRMVLTSHAGLKDLGWKSDIERQRRVEVWKRPGMGRGVHSVSGWARNRTGGGVVTAGCHHTDGRWLIGIVGGEDERAPVLTALVWSIFGTGDDVVPSVDGGMVSIK